MSPPETCCFLRAVRSKAFRRVARYYAPFVVKPSGGSRAIARHEPAKAQYRSIEMNRCYFKRWFLHQLPWLPSPENSNRKTIFAHQTSIEFLGEGLGVREIDFASNSTSSRFDQGNANMQQFGGAAKVAPHPQPLSPRIRPKFDSEAMMRGPNSRGEGSKSPRNYSLGSQLSSIGLKPNTTNNASHPERMTTMRRLSLIQTVHHAGHASRHAAR